MKRKRKSAKSAIILSQQDLDQELKRLPGWSIRDNRLVKEYKFESFNRTVQFYVGAAMCAEKMNHYPRYFNQENILSVELFTESLQAISTLDIFLARKMEEIIHGDTRILAA